MKCNDGNMIYCFLLSTQNCLISELCGRPEPLVEVHGVGDGVVPLERDDGEREHGQLRAQHPEEARELAADGELPGDGVLAELAQGASVQHRQEPCNTGRRHVRD